MDFSKELYEAKKIAIIAGKKILEIYRGQKYKVYTKEDNSPVTEADLAADKIIISRLKEAFPSYSILSEESEDDLSRLENDYCWIIDPIDGTKEFVNRNGEFTVNIALVYKHEVVVGVIYAPVLDELYYGEKGKGSYVVKDREYKRLKVSDRTGKINLAISKSHKSKADEELIEKYKDNIAKVYQVGSTLKGCFTAKGIIDVVYKAVSYTKEWDIAAMQLIVEEAGAIMRDTKHNKIIYNREFVVNEHGYYIVNRKENVFWEQLQ